MGNPHLKLVTPTIEKRTVMPRRAKNATLRTREYLTGHEDRGADGCGAAEPLRAPRRHHDPDRVPPRAARFRGRRPTLGPDRFHPGGPARTPHQGRHSQRAPVERGGDARPTPPATGGRCKPVRVRQRARRTLHDGRLRPDDGARGERRPASASRSTRTCCGTPAASRWPTPGTTPAPCKPISGTGISSTPCATPSWRPTASGNFRQTECDYKSPDT